MRSRVAQRASFPTPPFSGWVPLGRGSDGRFGRAGFAPNIERKGVWHLPRSRSRPATLGVLRSALFSAPAVFVRFAASEEQKQPETARKGKTMKLEEIKNRTKDAVEYLIQSLESGKGEVLTQYLSAMAAFPNYSFGNVMLIARQKPTATHVCGVRAWNQLGRFVKRGEKGIVILAPMVGYRRPRQEEIAANAEANRDEPQQERKQQLIGFRGVYVFDVSQTEGKELPGLTEVKGDVGGYLERLKAFVEGNGIRLFYSERLGAKGTSSGGTITLQTGMEPAEEFATLAHEIGHEMLHWGERRTLTTKRVRETEAEAVAFVVCRSIGLETGTASADYIQLYHGDARLLQESLEAVQRTAAVILGAISPEKPKQQPVAEPQPETRFVPESAASEAMATA